MIRELNTSLVSNDVDLAFPLVTFASSFRDESTMNPRAAADRRNRKRSNGIRLCFRAAWKKKKKIDEIAIPMRFNWKTVYSYSADWAESIREHDPFQPQTIPPPKHTGTRRSSFTITSLGFSSLFLFRKEILLPSFGFSPFPINKFWYFFFFSRSFGSSWFQLRVMIIRFVNDISSFTSIRRK